MKNDLQSMKFALGLEYDGKRYHGWQYQKMGISTIQKVFENSASTIANHKIHAICAGRTDSGVHSIGQVIHFNTFAIRKKISWILGINTHLPSDISVKWIKKVSASFHARYSAIARTYRYIIYNNKYRPALFNGKCHHIHFFLNVPIMHKASQLIIGEHNFTSFRSKNCQSSSPYRKIIFINVYKYNSFIYIDIKANSFLHHMVRNIVGCLIEIGMMKKKKEWMIYVLNKKNRFFCSPTAPSQGLYLISVDYPSYFHIPEK